MYFTRLRRHISVDEREPGGMSTFVYRFLLLVGLCRQNRNSVLPPPATTTPVGTRRGTSSFPSPDAGCSLPTRTPTM